MWQLIVDIVSRVHSIVWDVSPSVLIVAAVVAVIYLAGKFSLWSDPNAPVSAARDWWPLLPPQRGDGGWR